MPEFEKTSRPYPDINEALLAAVAATEGHGDEAIKLRFTPGENLEEFRNSLRAALRKQGLKLRYKYDKMDKALIVYAEQFNDGADTRDEDESDKASLTS